MDLGSRQRRQQDPVVRPNHRVFHGSVDNRADAAPKGFWRTKALRTGESAALNFPGPSDNYGRVAWPGTVRT